ncbi:hypothetical protein HI914_06590 [Erysiphe necator]|nr:hypothetical protein HI914_06590 [Erysiphe necator]
MLKDDVSDFFYEAIVNKNSTFKSVIAMTKSELETRANKQEYFSSWRNATFKSIMSEYQVENKLESFTILVETITKIQAGLSISYKEDYNLRDQLLNACKDIPECEVALNDPKSSFYELNQTEEFGNQFWIDWRYIESGGDGGGIRRGRHIGNERLKSPKYRQDRRNINENYGEEDIDKLNQYLLELDFQEDTHDYVKQYISDCGSVNLHQTLSILHNQSIFHAVTKHDIFKEKIDTKQNQIESRHSEREFQGIMPDSGAAGVSFAGEPQFLALQKIFPSIELDTSRAGKCNIRYGISNATSIGTVKVPTPLGSITFHVVPTNTPFLLCIQDMNKMGVKLDNLRNILSIAWCHLTEPQLRQLHRRFGYPSAQRLHRVLERAVLEVDVQLIKILTKYCHQCQMHGKSPGIFKVTLPKDYDFNYEIVVDIFHIDEKPVIHVVGQKVRKEVILQMTVKAVNDSAGPDGIIPTLLVFGAYPRMTENSSPSLSVTSRAEAVRKASKENQRI